MYAETTETLIDEPAAGTVKDTDETCGAHTDVCPVVSNGKPFGSDGLSAPVFIMISTPICLPVVAGNLALLFWSRKQTLVRPSLLMRLLILALVMEGFFLIFRYRNPPQNSGYASTEALMYVWLYGGQCILLLILEPGLRWWQRRRLSDKTESFFSHPLS
ncbi:MAG: hypothetical protein CME31_07430 [Gimesia sp.]|nr:hypothetical protein [Gimesia sp.]|tara:strand:+ start:4084 stop:4563 length:480 start_codon:yes stop_codon:yes gene_type:complete